MHTFRYCLSHCGLKNCCLTLEPQPWLLHSARIHCPPETINTQVPTGGKLKDNKENGILRMTTTESGILKRIIPVTKPLILVLFTVFLNICTSDSDDYTRVPGVIFTFQFLCSIIPFFK